MEREMEVATIPEGGESDDGSPTNVGQVEGVETFEAPEDVNANGSSKPPISAIATTSSIAIDWFSENHNQETIFQVKMKEPSATEWTLVYHGKDTSLTLNELPSGTSVAIHIRAINQGTNGWSGIALYKTLPSPPEAPTSLTPFYVQSHDLELTWCPPLHDGGYPISGFRLEMQILQMPLTQTQGASAAEDLLDHAPVFVEGTCGDSTRFVGEGLEPGVTYCFRVQARNQLGYGPFSEPAVVVTPTLPPATPEPPVVVEKTCKSVCLRWRSPPCNGAGIESFTLQLLYLGYGEKGFPTNTEGACASNLSLQGNNLTYGSSDDELEQGSVFERSVDISGFALHDIYSGPSNDFVVKKLRPFSTYAFRVQAQNATGSSGFSAFSICTTPAAAPYAPAPPTVVEAKSSSLTLNWEVPELDNGSPVFRYTLEMRKVEMNPRSDRRNRETLDGGRKFATGKLLKPVHMSSRVWVVVYGGLELRSTVSDLVPGNEYSFRVKARNALGTSAPSSTLVVCTLPAAPCAPLPPTFHRVTPTSVQIKWASPASDNGMPVTRYKLMLDDGQGGPLQKVYEGGVGSFNASKLTPTLRYHAAVQAINARGASAWSEAAVIELPDEIPVASPILATSAATVADDLPRTAPRHGRPVPASLDVVARRKPKPAIATVEVTSRKKERAVPAPAKAAASLQNEEAAPPESIKSIKEVKEILRLKARESGSQKVSRALIQTGWYIHRLGPLWAILICVGTVGAILALLFSKS